MALGQIIEKEIAVDLTEEEIEAKKDRLAIASLELRTQKVEKHDALSTHNSKLRDKQKEVDALVDSIDTKKEMRVVECMEERDDRRGEIITRRCDTKEEVASRAMTFEERQVTNDEHIEREGRGKKKAVESDDSGEAHPE